MDHFDEGLEKRVWQRVRGEVQTPSLQVLAAAERAAAAEYLMLSRSMQGREKELLRQLYQRERIHGRYLNGIHILSEGKPLSVRTAPPSVSRPAVALSRCYAASLRAAAEYESKAADTQYGHIFARMAKEEREHCAMILEILGGAQ